MAINAIPSKRIWIGYGVVFGTVLVSYALWLGALWFSGDLYQNLFVYPAKVGSHGALILMCWAILMATRARPIERLFGGLDKVYKAHHVVGVVSFALIFLHPVFLAIAYSDTLPETLRFLWFSGSWVRNTGIIALLAFIVLIALSIFVKIAYHNWKRTHDFFGVLLALFVLHLVIADGEIMQYAILRVWHGFWIVSALVGYVYIRLLYRFIGPLFEYEITGVREIGRDVTEVFLKPCGREMHHKPGQFVYISLDASAVSQEPHPLSISSPPGASEMRLSVKALGDWTDQMPELKPGELARIWGPYGRFSHAVLSHPRVPVLMAGGGIGITPFLSLVQSDLFGDRASDSFLVYSVAAEADAVYDGEIRPLAEKLPHFTYRRHISDDEGFLDRAYFEKLLDKPLTEYLFLVCGPTPMMDSISAFLKDEGVPRRQIVMEEFET